MLNLWEVLYFCACNFISNKLKLIRVCIDRWGQVLPSNINFLMFYWAYLLSISSSTSSIPIWVFKSSPSHAKKKKIKIPHVLVCVLIFCYISLYPRRLRLQNTPTSFLQRGKTLTNKCLDYDIKQPDGEASVMQWLWAMLNNSLLPLLSCWLWPRVVVHDRVLSMG